MNSNNTTRMRFTSRKAKEEACGKTGNIGNAIRRKLVEDFYISTRKKRKDKKFEFT